MSNKSTPWSQTEAEKWAKEYRDNRDVLVSIDAAKRAGFLMGLAKAAEMIEACPTISTMAEDGKNPLDGHEWYVDRPSKFDTHQAKLVGVLPIGKEKQTT